MDIKKWIRKRKLWLILLGIIIIGLIIYFIFHFSQIEVPDSGEKVEEEIPEEFKGDKKRPLSKIVFPAPNSFHNNNFSVKVWDVDTGGSDLDTSQCKYSVYNCAQTPCLLTLFEVSRPCNGNIPLIVIGNSGSCSPEGINVCRVVVRSKDRAGNSNIVSEAENSLRDFSIDWTPPKVEIITSSLPQEDISQTISARVSDNIGISGCDFFIDGQSQYKLCLQQGTSLQECEEQLDFVETPCPSKITGKCYLVSQEYAFTTSGNHKIYTSCWDRAGNLGYSQVLEVKIPINHSPQISFCKVNPTQGNIQANFQFIIETTDPDGDTLTYKWDFGDGEISNEKNPTHRYIEPGTYQPKVEVFDEKGAKDNCSTAWVTVAEE